MKPSFLRTTFCLLATVTFLSSCAISNYDLKRWTKEQSPIEIGNKLAWRFNASAHTNFNKTTPPRVITYPESCAWYGALTFAKESKNSELKDALIKRFQPLFAEEAKMIPIPDHVDYAVFGAVPLEIYNINKEQKYLNMGKDIADKQWDPPFGPRVTKDSQKYYDMGLTWETRLWIDDMYMITAIQSQAYRATGDEKYIARAAKEMVFYLDQLQQPNGLFYHAPDVPFFWGRGDGWMAAGMAELLRSLPKSNSNYDRIMKGYRLMMASLLKYQTKEGMWRQLIDDPEAWPETSSTGIFTFAMITGVKNGWLDQKTYGTAARKGWLALISYLNADGDVREVCEGTNKKNSRQYYLDRKRNIGDLHGQAPILWCATALLR
jgi:rhamnogalacturonyl hydrolase YesR